MSENPYKSPRSMPERPVRSDLREESDPLTGPLLACVILVAFTAGVACWLTGYLLGAIGALLQ